MLSAGSRRATGWSSMACRGPTRKTGERRDGADQQAEQRRLARAVRTRNGYGFGAGNGQIQILDDGRFAFAAGQVFDLEDGPPCGEAAGVKRDREALQDLDFGTGLDEAGGGPFALTFDETGLGAAAVARRFMAPETMLGTPPRLALRPPRASPRALRSVRCWALRSMSASWRCDTVRSCSAAARSCARRAS